MVLRNDDSELEAIFFLSLATITSTERKLLSTFSFFPMYSLEISLLICSFISWSSVSKISLSSLFKSLSIFLISSMKICHLFGMRILHWDVSKRRDN